MSWFKRKPKLKEPPKHLPHKHYSPTTERLMEESKKTGPSKEHKKSK